MDEEITPEELIEQLVAVNEGRAEFYLMLAHIYWKELTQEQVEHLAGLDLSEFAGGDELMTEGYHDMQRYLRRLNTGTRQQLAVDYAHTFLAAGNYETFAATPFESVFKSELGLLMQEPRDEVYKMYCEQHIQPDEELHVPEDHVTFEFQFLAELLHRTNAALKAGDVEGALSYARTVQRFHTEHQLNWIDDLCDAIADVAQTRFYRGVGKVTRGFVHFETEVISDEVEALQELAVLEEPGQEE